MEIIVVGESGTGKTTVLNKIRQLFEGQCAPFDKEFVFSETTPEGYALTLEKMKQLLERDLAKPQEKMPSALDVQEGGGHYKGQAIQPVEYNHANNIPFIEGSVIKYVSRHRNKNGAQDIRKAIHFLQLLLELEYKEASQ